MRVFSRVQRVSLIRRDSHEVHLKNQENYPQYPDNKDVSFEYNETVKTGNSRLMGSDFEAHFIFV